MEEVVLQRTSEQMQYHKGSLLRRQRSAHQLTVVAYVDALIGKRRVGPDHRSFRQLVARIDQVSTAQLFIALRRKPGDDEVALFVEDKEAVFVLDQERVGPALLLAARRLEGFPDAVAFEIETTKLAVAAD